MMSGSPSPSEVREALERAFPIFATGGLSNAMYRADEVSEGEGWALDNTDFDALAGGAQAWLDLFEECENCNGKGEVEVQDTGHFPWTCDACNGLGVIPNRDGVEAAAMTLDAWEWGKHRLAIEQAQAAIRAFLGLSGSPEINPTEQEPQ